MIDTTKILPGQEFKNMQELSVALTGQKMPAGKGYVLQQEKFKLYFSWKKITGTHKLIIDEIYKEPKTKPKRKQKEYCPHGKYNSAIYANLQHLELNKKYSVTDLYELLGFTSDSLYIQRRTQTSRHSNRLHGRCKSSSFGTNFI